MPVLDKYTHVYMHNIHKLKRKQRCLLFCQISFTHMWQKQEADIFDCCPGLMVCCWQRLLERLVVPHCLVSCCAFCPNLWVVVYKWGCPWGDERSGNRWTHHREQNWITEEISNNRETNILHCITVSSLAMSGTKLKFYFFKCLNILFGPNNDYWMHFVLLCNI